MDSDQPASQPQIILEVPEDMVRQEKPKITLSADSTITTQAEILKKQQEKPLIEVINLSKSFGDKVVLEHVNFSVNKGESFVIMGGSGTGKSILLKCILGLIEPDKGEILVDGVDILELDISERRTVMKRFGMLFQGGALFDSLTIAENISFGLIQGFNYSKAAALTIAMEKIKAVELPASVANQLPAELSGGMQKRAALARAIATTPDVIFFDEPTTGLDPILSSTINELIKKCTNELNSCAITVTHDMKSLKHIADKVGLLHEGKFIWQGSVEELDTTDNPYVQQFVKGEPYGPFTTPAPANIASL